MFIVYDLDGTIANIDHRVPLLDAEYETESEKWDTFFDACDGDGVYPEIALLFDMLVHRCFIEDRKVEIWTGRSEKVREKTERWLRLHLREFNSRGIKTELRMRAIDDFREDTEVKGDWIKEYGRPDLVFDDRTKMVNWWRDQGIACCQVRNSEY